MPAKILLSFRLRGITVIISIIFGAISTRRPNRETALLFQRRGQWALLLTTPMAPRTSGGPPPTPTMAILLFGWPRREETLLSPETPCVRCLEFQQALLRLLAGCLIWS